MMRSAAPSRAHLLITSSAIHAVQLDRSQAVSRARHHFYTHLFRRSCMPTVLTLPMAEVRLAPPGKRVKCMLNDGGELADSGQRWAAAGCVASPAVEEEENTAVPELEPESDKQVGDRQDHDKGRLIEWSAEGMGYIFLRAVVRFLNRFARSAKLTVQVPVQEEDVPSSCPHDVLQLLKSAEVRCAVLYHEGASLSHLHTVLQISTLAHAYTHTHTHTHTCMHAYTSTHVHPPTHPHTHTHKNTHMRCLSDTRYSTYVKSLERTRTRSSSSIHYTYTRGCSLSKAHTH
jgi:hypothetical protein